MEYAEAAGPVADHWRCGELSPGRVPERNPTVPPADELRRERALDGQLDAQDESDKEDDAGAESDSDLRLLPTDPHGPSDQSGQQNQ